jgi:hypothetical protein
MFVVWGPQEALLYNDAYAEIRAGKPPRARGHPICRPAAASLNSTAASARLVAASTYLDKSA